MAGPGRDRDDLGSAPAGVLEEILESYPFKILGFHSNNGSEYVNHKEAAMLDEAAGAGIHQVAPAALQ